jgi:Secretion system C-terminal sorting domain
MNTNNHGDWTIVVGAGICASSGIFGWSGTDANLYNTAAHQYTNSYTWSNKNTNKYQMDAGISLNLYPAVTYQHSNGNSSSNYVQIAWQSTDALNNYMGKTAGSTTIVSVTCDRNGNPIPVAATNSIEPEYQIVPHYYSNGAMPSLGDSSGVNNFKSQSHVSLAGRNSIQNDQLVVYFDAANGNVNLPTWDEVIIKENVTVSSGFRSESVAAVESANEVNVRIYPNPVAEHITLESSVSDAAMMVSMFDMNGRLVMRAQGNSADLNNQLNAVVSGLSNGTYMLQVNSQGALVYNDKIVKMASN